ncbi:hypothetical protein UNDYM_3987 [Undibacterium sp. YM2]|uniref:hypothetical protein n=1 Tax=Undibacterium sp. YM2 TaxID=2058625 RepID=UPI001331DBEC|nr:hypothetical protein [Undibacterium sp. YM2]BBB68240.1 hypothetical protein UNDYM_3987 [Undibacterium sp. YM2]
MPRVLSTALTFVDNIYYLDNELFSGTVFDIAHGVVSANNYINGKYDSPYQPDYFSNTDVGLQIVAFASSGDDENSQYLPLIYQGKAFTGIVYHFWNNQCDCEVAYLEGEWRIAAHWSGDLLYSLEIDGEHGYEEYGWHTNKLLEKFNHTLDPDNSCSSNFDVDGNICYLQLSENYFECIGERLQSCRYSPFKSRAELSSLQPAKVLVLSGAGIGDDLLHNLFCHSTSVNLAKKCGELTFKDTLLSLKSLDLLCAITDLKKVKIENATDSQHTLAQALIAARPDIEVRYESRQPEQVVPAIADTKRPLTIPLYYVVNAFILVLLLIAVFTNR